MPKMVIVIAPTTSQPRYHKRVRQLSTFFPVRIFAFNRGYYEKNFFPKSFPYISLGKINDRNYLKRVYKLIYAISKVRKNLPPNKDLVFYAFSLDCVITAKLAGIKNGYLEVSDLIMSKGIGKFAWILEKIITRDVLGLVLTSKAFYSDYYRYRLNLPSKKVYIIDNKVDKTLANIRPKLKEINKERIVIGLIGLLRYEKPIRLLISLVKRKPEKLILECFGDGPSRYLIENNACENIRYNGSFQNPDKIPEIYSKIDINYAVYDNSLLNVRLALPNKLFESAFFGVPIVCCDSTFVGKIAKNWGIGDTVRIKNQKLFEEDIIKITNINWLIQASKRCFSIPSSFLIDDGEVVLEKMFNMTNV